MELIFKDKNNLNFQNNSNVHTHFDSIVNKNGYIYEWYKNNYSLMSEELKTIYNKLKDFLEVYLLLLLL